MIIVVLCSLSHKSIIPVYGICRGRRRGSVYLITELFDYTLDDLIHFQAPLTEVSLYRHSVTIRTKSKPFFARSSTFFHSSTPNTFFTGFLSISIPSSDLKPGNILCKKGKIALCDWGSATHTNTPSQPPTLGYRAPELLLWKESMDPAYWSPAVDVWSWGILVVELLTKHYLIESDSELATLNRFARMAGTEPMSEAERKQLDDCNEHSLLRFGSIRGAVEEAVPNASPAVLAVLRDCFHFMPAGRKSAEELRRSEWMQGCGGQEELADWGQWVREKRDEKKKKTWEMWQELQRMLMEKQ